MTEVLEQTAYRVKAGEIFGQQRRPVGVEPVKRVLLLHGWQDNSNSYVNLIPLLPKNWWIVAIDWPGHGHSSPRGPGAAYHITDWLVDLREVVNVLQWQKFTLIGHSMGAGVALMYGALFPEEVEAVVALDVIKQLSEPAGTTHKVLRNAIMTLADHNQKTVAPQKPEIMSKNQVEQWWHGQSKAFMNEQSAAKILERGMRQNSGTTADEHLINRDSRLTFPPLFRMHLDQHRNVLKELKCDLLIIKAAGAQNYESPEVEKEFKDMYQKNCSHFAYIVVDGLHHVHLDRPETVAPVIVDFLEHRPIKNSH
ncbi:serine hydrolase-like protein [Paramacrobiotus metropolitanus]|uniref:serine hydrolase-like protein n=1 Tax=Paramacrobiotus metropolitanus TaxID=2943436 RepID=UPI0024463C05|nr:serine hydrolase-like protein [Paramacrobiotus metropolitanus]